MPRPLDLLFPVASSPQITSYLLLKLASTGIVKSEGCGLGNDPGKGLGKRRLPGINTVAQFNLCPKFFSIPKEDQLVLYPFSFLKYVDSLCFVNWPTIYSAAELPKSWEEYILP